jgi:predicted SprT family Zn-dependent metalloprotease
MALSRPPNTIPRIRTLRSITLSDRPTSKTVGMTRYGLVEGGRNGPGARQRIAFYTELLDELSDSAAEAVIAHELAHVWLNEHLRPEQSKRREKEADDLAREWGFAPELEALERETLPA